MKKKTLEKCIRMLATAMCDGAVGVLQKAGKDVLEVLESESGHTSMGIEWPEWAQYLAMDENRDWYFYKSKPEIRNSDCRWHADVPFVRANYSSVADWAESLIERKS